MTRRQWDQDLSELVGGSSDPDAPAIANRIERAVRRYEAALEWIDRHYENVILTHEAFRVEAKHRAYEALNEEPPK